MHSQERYDALIDHVSFHEGKKHIVVTGKNLMSKHHGIRLRELKDIQMNHSGIFPDNGWHSDVTEWTVYSLKSYVKMFTHISI